MNIIQANQIGRKFKSIKKAQGIKGSLQLLTKPEYSEHEALKSVTLNIEEGSFVGLIGANGAGKTTLLKILSGLIPPTSGSVEVLGVDPFTRPVHFKKQIALVMGQKAQLWWDLPAIDAFDLIKAIYNISNDEFTKRLELLCSVLDVSKLLNTQIRRLSLGERMKMELIGALLHWPKVIFLDEPTIGLDVLAASKLRDFLKKFNEETKATIILTSHNMDDIEKLCSRVMILKEGQLIYDGKPTGLVKVGECRLRVSLRETPEIHELSEVTKIKIEAIGKQEVSEGEADEGESENANANANENESSIPGFYFNITQKEIVSVLQSLMNKYQIINMGIEEQSLESVIQRIYENK